MNFKKIFFIFLCLLIGLGLSIMQLSQASNGPTQQELVQTLDKAIKAFWNERGVFHHAEDGELVGWANFKTIDNPDDPRWGIDDKNRPNKPVVSILEPGICGAGIAFLKAYEVTKNKLYLQYALEVGKTLISIQKDRPYPGWSSHAVVIPQDLDRDDAGHWTSASLSKPREHGNLAYPSQDRPYVTFDDGISLNGATYLIELYAAIKYLNDLDLGSIDKNIFKQGAENFFNMVNDFTTLKLEKDNFQNLRIDNGYEGKNGLHPFNAYLAGLPEDHPLNRNEDFQPYANGGLPQGMRAMKDMLLYGGTQYGALTAGYPLHKTLNDHEMSRLLLFLMRYYDVTHNSKALVNLEKQLNWLVKVFKENGNRAWCQQYHVLDEKCAPARPWESPALAIPESIKLIDSIAYVEKTLEEKFHRRNNEVRFMLENAIYYIHKKIKPDDITDRQQKKFFRFYALDNYNQRTNPSANMPIQANDPLYSCDYYYTSNPYTQTCSSPDSQSYNYYSIDEQAGEFQSPEAFVVDNISAGGAHNYAIRDECLNDLNITSFFSCLDLNKTIANQDNYWDHNRVYWGWSASEYIPPNNQGLWTSNIQLYGDSRTIINTGDFRKNVIYLAAQINPDEIANIITGTSLPPLEDLEVIRSPAEDIKDRPGAEVTVIGPIFTPFKPTPTQPTIHAEPIAEGPTIWGDTEADRTYQAQPETPAVTEPGPTPAAPVEEPQIAPPPETSPEPEPEPETKNEEPLDMTAEPAEVEVQEEEEPTQPALGGCARVKNYLLH
ncbi:MAG: hypothetical protein ABH859_01070 [Pseudomonadota bacterium]